MNIQFQLTDAYCAYCATKIPGRRASGQLMTPAKWMRHFVQVHPSYKQDSIITPAIACDLMTACQRIGDGSLPCHDILGDVRIERCDLAA